MKVGELVKEHGFDAAKMLLGTAFAAGVLWATAKAENKTRDEKIAKVEQHVEQHDESITDLKVGVGQANAKLDIITELLKSRRRGP